MSRAEDHFPFVALSGEDFHLEIMATQAQDFVDFKLAPSTQGQTANLGMILTCT